MATSSMSPAGSGGRRPSAPTVLVTGGSGFIGTTLVSRLRAEGVAVRVADLVPFPDPDVPAVTGDLRRDEVLQAALAPGTEAVFHLAAMTSVLESVQHPEEVYRTNVAMTAALLERSRQLGVAGFVLASTNAVVGDGLRVARRDAAGPRAGQAGPRADVIDEAAPLRPLTPYGATKAAAEMLLSAYTASYGMAASSARLTNVYGPGMARKDSIVPRLMRAALSGDTIRVYGDGLQVRDYLHVQDAVAGLVLAWRAGASGPVTLGSGRSSTVLDVVESARAVTARPIPVEHIEARPGEMRAVVVDTRRARVLGFRPELDLRAGLVTAWDDFRQAAS